MTQVTRVSTSQRYDSLLQAMQQNKADVARAESEVATGRKQDVFAEGAGRTGLTVELRGKKEVLDTQIAVNQVSAARQDTAATLLSDVSAGVLALRDILVQPQAWRTSPGAVTDAARATLGRVVDALNTSYGGSYLFSGRMTDTQPYVSDGAGGFVYQGDTAGENLVPVGPGSSTTLAPRGDSPALAQTIAVLGQLANTDLTGMSQTDIELAFAGAMAQLNQAYDGITALEGAHGNAQAQLANTLTSQKALSVSYNNTIVDVEGVDPEEAAIRLKAAQTRLDATYAITAQMANLSLLNHL